MANTRLHKGGLPPAGWEFVPGSRTLIRQIALPAPLGGKPGDEGKPGASAFEVAVSNGFQGTEVEWLASLQQAPVTSEQIQAQVKPVAESWLQENIVQPVAVKGDKGDDAPALTSEQIQAQVKPVAESWLRKNIKQPVPIKGDKGDDGKSAYALAVIAGFKGDLAAWLRSLRGETRVITNTAMGGGGVGISPAEVQQLIDAALEDALAGPIEVKNDEGTQLRADSGEVEYAPGLTTFLVNSAGPTTVYTAPADKAFRLRWANAIPALRGVEDAPVITIRILDAGDALFKTAYVGAAISKRQLITCPLGGKIVVDLDIAARVPCTFNIEEFTP